GDGFGKDFQLLNLRGEAAEEKTRTLLLGNLLSFYEQQRCFMEQAEPLRPYNLDKPLWVFVGSSVNAVFAENRRRRSDVLTVARFLHHFLENKNDWAIAAIKMILEGRTGLTGDDGEDLFTGRFAYLRRGSTDPEAIYRGVLAAVFRAAASGALHICGIRGRAGELGLRCGASEEYFGLIYIGDAGAFKNLVRAEGGGIVLEEDAMRGSLFDSLNDPDAGINILIGAKKFMEGWNSWRVSHMGLLNIGRREGAEIVQLFGRGVRLRGKGLSLRRSAALPGEHPPYIGLLETLNIFAVRADYMAQFRQYLEREGVETAGRTVPPPDGLSETPRPPVARRGAAENGMILAPDRAIRVRVDVSLELEAMRSAGGGVTTKSLRTGRERVIPPESLDLVDWEAIYLALMDFKEQRGFDNLVLRPGALRAILEARLYALIADEAAVRPGSFAGRALLQETVLSILRAYVEEYYRVKTASGAAGAAPDHPCD
ncbi:MAG: restriction endonuclease subunit R, partial [Bacteroidota bacterium]